MQTSRREILDDFLDFLTEKGDATARTKAERALNRAVLAIWLKRSWADFVAAQPYTFATTAGARSYSLPDYFGRPSGRDGQIRNVTLGGYISPAERESVESEDPAFGTALEVQAVPRRYLLDGNVGVGAQPAAAGEACEVVSSDGADVNVRAYVEGIDSTGSYARTQVTLNGLTPVTVGSWKRIETFGKSLPAGLDPATDLTTSVGSVTLRTTAAATTLQLLLPDESAVEHPQLTLYPTPDATYTISVPYLRAPRRLLHDADPLPRYWGNAVFEELCVQWQVNRGTFASDAQVPRPHLTDLIMFDQAARVPSLRYRQPFTGGWR